MSSPQNQKYWLKEDHLTHVSVTLLAFIALSFALSYAKTLAVPLVIAILIYYVMSPLIVVLKNKLGFARPVAILTTIFLFGVCLFALGYFVSDSIGNVLSGYEQYQKKILSFLPLVTEFTSKIGLTLSEKALKNQILELPFFSYLKGAAGLVVNFLNYSTLVIIYVLFMISGSHFDSGPQSEFWEKVNQQIRRYVITKLITSVTTGILVGISLAILGIDFPVMFGLLTIILNFIPTLGSIGATLLPIPLALMEFTEAWRILLVIAIPGTIQMTIGTFLEPRMLGKSVGLHPIAVLASLIFWSMLWGVAGAFLAVPITAIVKIIFERLEGTQGLAKILSGELPKAQSASLDSKRR